MWRRYLVFGIAGLLLIGLTATFLLQHRQQAVSIRLGDDAAAAVERLHTLAHSKLDHVVRDLHYLAALARLQFDDIPAGPGHPRQSALSETLQAFSDAEAVYDQVRVIDLAGQEVLRIDYPAGVARIVPGEQLQNKRHRYYFADAITLQPGRIYVSPFDLNVENHLVEVPLKPMIRFATPFVDTRGDKAGLIVLNYLGRLLLSDFDEIAKEGSGDILLLNHRGEYLRGFTPEQSWGFMFADRPDNSFADRHSSLWRQMQRWPTDRGSLLANNEDRFSFTRLAIPGAEPGCEHCTLWIVHHLPQQAVRQQVQADLQAFVPTAAALVLVFAGVLGALAWNVVQRERAGQRVQMLNRRILHERNLFADGPSVVFRWRNEFGWPVSYVSTNVRKVLGYDPLDFVEGRLGFASIVVPGDLARITRELADAIAHGERHIERPPYEVVDAAGQHRWMRESVQLEYDADAGVVQCLAYLNDITGLKQAQQELERSRGYVQKLVDAIPDPTLVIDVADYRVVSANQAARHTYLDDLTAPDALTCFELSHKTNSPCSGDDEPCPIREIVRSGKAARVVHRHFDARGLPFYVEVNATPIHDEAGQVVQIVESHRDVTEHVKTEQALSVQANTDGMTGASNRARLEQLIAEQLLLAGRTGNRPGLIMFDLDHFKEVNDTYGHDTGDRVLIDLVKAVSRHIRESDWLARWGGEEFMLLVPHTDAGGLQKLAESLREAIAGYDFKDVRHVTASFGATLLAPGDDMHSLVKRADRALYASKHDGRNRVTVDDASECSEEASPDHC